MEAQSNSVKIIKEMQSLLDSQARWTKHTNYRDSHGNELERTSENICRRCIHGAYHTARLTYKDDKDQGWDILRRAVSIYTGGNFGSPISFNDSEATSFEDIQGVLTQALGIALSEEAANV